jgi:hypothetical protein
MRNRDTFRRSAGGVFKCTFCGRAARKTNATAGWDHNGCADCFQLLSIYNTLSDYGADEVRRLYTEDVKYHVENIRKAGGTPSPEALELEQVVS